ncbi:hypothetical protein L596_018038 [Steinernema carpocapsae]|uniref:Uncharacterized protein n=1 Tax=Steinernema carpocapsae TaxID=34508 RepID=A0A4U5N3X2_STECR|nr:hypothetical protein L596_018038 [Steinernema carpocapsae]
MPQVIIPLSPPNARRSSPLLDPQNLPFAVLTFGFAVIHFSAFCRHPIGRDHGFIAGQRRRLHRILLEHDQSPK